MTMSVTDGAVRPWFELAKNVAEQLTGEGCRSSRMCAVPMWSQGPPGEGLSAQVPGAVLHPLLAGLDAFEQGEPVGDDLTLWVGVSEPLPVGVDRRTQRDEVDALRGA